MSRRPLALALLAVVAFPGLARAQSGGLIDVCTGIGVDLPVLQPVTGAVSGLLGGLLDPVLNGIVGDVNLNLRDALSGRNIGLSIRDQNGNLVTLPGNCKLKADSVTVEGPGGTQATDAVNLRQLRSVANSTASALGGGAGFDANGNFAGPHYALRSGIYTNVGAALTALDQRIDDVAAYAREGRREARQGVAAAMAMTAAPMPSQPGKTSWSGNTATYKGEWAAGFAVAHRLDVALPVAINAAVSLASNSFGGARFGMSGEF